MTLEFQMYLEAPLKSSHIEGRLPMVRAVTLNKFLEVDRFADEERPPFPFLFVHEQSLPQVYEVDRSALVAGYVGQTALKVQDAVEKAKGGVLFIDEAYSLSADSGAGFGDEAISTLVKAMEDHRENLAIIVAGYKEPMKQFIESNQGLKSRFQNYIHFSDYSSQELLNIFEELCHSHKMEIDQPAREGLLKHIEAAKPQGDQGNARYIRNLFEKMYLNMSHRAAEDGQIDLQEILTFKSNDIPDVELRKQTIGFMPKKD